MAAPENLVFRSALLHRLSHRRTTAAHRAALFMCRNLVNGREADEDVDNAGYHRVHATKQHADVPFKQPDQEPVQAADNQQDERDHVNFHSM